jgi:hypothetical protein
MDEAREELKLKRAFILSLIVSGLLTLLIALIEPLLSGFSHLPDQGPAWYYWKLADPTALSRALAWLLYGLHQVCTWLLVFLAMKERQHLKKLSRINLAFLSVNLIFILSHITKTLITYDGLAQDVPVWSSQFSVIIMLVIMIFMLNPRRGFILGKKIPYSKGGLAFVDKWHGIYISWALVYTYWFHPADGVVGLLFGFFYMFLLLTQLSFANTKIHFLLPWVTLLEFIVGVHGPIIALQNAQSAWPMFVSGFFFMTAFTQQFSFKLPAWGRALVFLAYAAGVGVMYYFRGYEKLYEVLFIPAALYGGALLLAFVTWIPSLFGRKGAARIAG